MGLYKINELNVAVNVFCLLFLDMLTSIVSTVPQIVLDCLPKVSCVINIMMSWRVLLLNYHSVVLVTSFGILNNFNLL